MRLRDVRTEVALLAALIASSACTVEPTRLRVGPSRDVSVTYGQPTGTVGDGPVVDGGIMRVRMKAGCTAERIEPAGASRGDVVIVDRLGGRVTRLLAGRQAYSEQPIHLAERQGTLLCAGPDGLDRFKRIGPTRQPIAGLLCTEWTRAPRDLQDLSSIATLCVTAEGVILAYQDGVMRMRATEASFAPLEAALFQRPPGLERVPPPTRPARDRLHLE